MKYTVTLQTQKNVCNFPNSNQTHKNVCNFPNSNQTHKNVCNFPNSNLFLDLLKILADIKI